MAEKKKKPVQPPTPTKPKGTGMIHKTAREIAKNKKKKKDQLDQL